MNIENLQLIQGYAFNELTLFGKIIIAAFAVIFIISGIIAFVDIITLPINWHKETKFFGKKLNAFEDITSILGWIIIFVISGFVLYKCGFGEIKILEAPINTKYTYQVQNSEVQEFFNDCEIVSYDDETKILTTKENNW